MTRSQAVSGARFRQRKLNTRSPISIIREDDLEILDDELQGNVPRIDTGIEKAEEQEHHLQAALSASQAAAIGGKVSQIYIPTPDAILSAIDYGKLYSLTYSQPTSYIRFSSTVEDCAGCPYDMDALDDAFLSSFNSKRDASAQCSEDLFEEIMNCFEETAQVKQPYAAVDSPPVLSYDEIEQTMDDYLDDNVRPFTKDVYEHWKGRRWEAGNKSLITGLKLETGADTDDADPYVCFRRREVRQIRKTRGRDAHSAEKLKKLRKELEEARELLAMIRQRELNKREQLAIDRLLFEQRTNLRQLKLNLPDQYRQGDEELLINQKPKKKPLEINQRLPNVQQLQRRPDGRPAEADLLLLSDLLADQERQMAEQINMKIRQHKLWNEGFVDWTKAPMTPPPETGIGSSFRTATTEYLPTPPASISSEHSGEIVLDSGGLDSAKRDSVSVRYASPSSETHYHHGHPSFRRRIGRGGRLWIDRKATRSWSSNGMSTPEVERFRFDNDDDDDNEPMIDFVDPFEKENMQFRARLITSPTQVQLQARRAQMEANARQPRPREVG